MAWRPGAAAGAGPGRELLAASGGTCRLWDSYRTWLAGALRGEDSRVGGPPPGPTPPCAPAHRPAACPMSSGCRMFPVWRPSPLLRARIGRRSGPRQGALPFRDRGERHTDKCAQPLDHRPASWYSRVRLFPLLVARRSRGAHGAGAGVPGPSATARAFGRSRGAHGAGARRSVRALTARALGVRCGRSARALGVRCGRSAFGAGVRRGRSAFGAGVRRGRSARALGVRHLLPEGRRERNRRSAPVFTR